MSSLNIQCPASIAETWWHGLHRSGDRASLARLRRAATATDAATEMATLDLCRRLDWGWQQLARVAVTAAVLAHVREDARDASVARQLKPVMSWLRFQRLIQTTTDDERLIAFRRAVALARGRLNVRSLADGLLHWNDETRRRWLYDYYGGGPSMNSETTTIDENLINSKDISA